MKNVKKLFGVVLIALIFAFVVPDNAPLLHNITTAEAAKISISKKKAILIKGQSLKLEIKNTSQKIKWSTSNKKIATVNKSGKVTAKKKGKATITASIGDKKYKCVVTVKNVPSIGTESKPISAFSSTTIDIANYGATRYKKVQLQLKELILGNQAEDMLDIPYDIPSDQQWVYMRFNTKYISNKGYSSSDELYYNYGVAGNYYLTQLDLLYYGDFFFKSSKIPVANYSIKYGYIVGSSIPNIGNLRLEPSQSSDFYIMFTIPKAASPLTYRIPTGYDIAAGKVIYTWFTTEK